MKPSKDVKPYSYVRDRRSPTPKNDTVSRVMSANRAKDTTPEIIVRRQLTRNHIHGYELHCRELPGTPDICFYKPQIAVFINGCYWHRCPYCKYDLPKTNTTFWKSKFENNIKRDRRNRRKLWYLGWKTITIWECQIENDVRICVNRIINRLK